MTMALQEASAHVVGRLQGIRKRAAGQGFGRKFLAGGQCPHFATNYLCQPRSRTPPKSLQRALASLKVAAESRTVIRLAYAVRCPWLGTPGLAFATAMPKMDCALEM